MKSTKPILESSPHSPQHQMGVYCKTEIKYNHSSKPQMGYGYVINIIVINYS